MWGIDGHEDTLAARACGVPPMFQHFKGYNRPETTKHRKRGHNNLTYQDLIGYSECLFQLCECRYLQRDAWKGVYNSLLRLADNLRKYSTYLDQHVALSQEAQARKTARTDVDEWRVYYPTNMTPTKQAKYKCLHDALRHAEPYQPIFGD